MKRSSSSIRDFEECEPPTAKRQEAQNATALLNYFDSMAMAAEADCVELAPRHVLDIERLPLFRALSRLIVDAYFKQRAVRLRGKRLCYKRRHQEATLLSYKERVIHALATGYNKSDATDDSNPEAETNGSSGGGDEDDDDEIGTQTQRPATIGTHRLGSDEQLWCLCDAPDRQSIGRVRLFAAWWFANFAVVLLAIRYRKELVTYTLSIENRVRSVCNLNTLVPWCIDLTSELAVDDAAADAPSDPDAQAAAVYATCRYLSDGVISNQTARLVGFICINAMHSTDACLPPISASATVAFDPQCGVFQHPLHTSTTAAAMHYNLERAVRIGNLAMHFFVRQQLPTVPSLCIDSPTILQAALEWLNEQQQRRRRQQPKECDGRFVKGFLAHLVKCLESEAKLSSKTD